MHPMEQSFCLSESEFSKSAYIKTTLYKLIEAVNDEIKPDEAHWVPLIVNHILCSGRSIPSYRRK
jgi:hypothetical protein